jgi:hypothetical protein
MTASPAGSLALELADDDSEAVALSEAVADSLAEADELSLALSETVADADAVSLDSAALSSSPQAAATSDKPTARAKTRFVRLVLLT